MFYGSVNVATPLYASCVHGDVVVFCSVESVCVVGARVQIELDVPVVEVPTVRAEYTNEVSGTFCYSWRTCEEDTLSTVVYVDVEVNFSHFALVSRDKDQSECTHYAAVGLGSEFQLVRSVQVVGLEVLLRVLFPLGK